MHIRLGFLVALSLCLLSRGALVPGPAAAAIPQNGPIHAPIGHVLLLSVDGLHASDLARWTREHPASALSRLARYGVNFTDVKATTPSDSFPGMLALVTGGTPRTTGVYYDDSYDRTLFPPGSACRGKPGTEIVLTELIDRDASRLFGGGIDPANLPLAKDGAGRCGPVYPHSFLKVNTVFEVARKAGLGTAWSDKHPAYDLLNGPSGSGVADLYTPEIDSSIKNGGIVQGVDLSATLSKCDGTNSLPPANVKAYPDCVPAQEAYDDIKVRAVLNEIDGKKSDGTAGLGVPAIFGMNFQAVSVAQKLPVGGYLADGAPSANFEHALAHTDISIGRLIAELHARRLWRSTLCIVVAKHGQSPIERASLAMQGATHAAIRNVADPIEIIRRVAPTVETHSFRDGAETNGAEDFAVGAHFQSDDVGILWLQDPIPAKVAAVAAELAANAASIHANALPADTLMPASIVYGAALAKIFGDPNSDDPVARARAPDVFIQPNAGVIYSDSSKKIAEHGGGTPDDTDVALVLAGGRVRPGAVEQRVFTTQVAPTILSVLGLDPLELIAVRKEHTAPLPGLKIIDR